MKAVLTTFRFPAKRIIFWVFLFSLVASTAGAETVVSSTTLSESRFDDVLYRRAEQYILSVQAKVNDVMPECRQQIDRQTRQIVLKGYAKIGRPSRLMQKRSFDATDLKQTVQTLKQIVPSGSNPALLTSLIFLGQNFSQPTDWEVAVRAALPASYCRERIHGILSRHNPLGGLDFGLIGLGSACSMAIVRTASEKSFDLISLFKAVSDELRCIQPDRYHVVQSDNLLCGYPLIAQTIVLRN